jgi:hypothetical protein
MGTCWLGLAISSSVGIAALILLLSGCGQAFEEGDEEGDSGLLRSLVSPPEHDAGVDAIVIGKPDASNDASGGTMDSAQAPDASDDSAIEMDGSLPIDAFVADSEPDAWVVDAYVADTFVADAYTADTWIEETSALDAWNGCTPIPVSTYVCDGVDRTSATITVPSQVCLSENLLPLDPDYAFTQGTATPPACQCAETYTCACLTATPSFLAGFACGTSIPVTCKDVPGQGPYLSCLGAP